MSIQFTNYFNKTIQWSDEQAENTLKAICLAQKNTTLIHTDLSVTQNNFFSQLIWDIFSLIPCIRNWIFDTNLEYSITAFMQLKPQIEGKDSNLIALFNKAVNNIAEFASSLTPDLKEQLLINQECALYDDQVALFNQSAIISHKPLENEKLQASEDGLFEGSQAIDSLKALSALELCKDVWQINSTKVSFLRNIEISRQSGKIFASFDSSSNYSILKDKDATKITIFLKKQKCNKINQLTTAVKNVLIDSKASGLAQVIFQLPTRNVSGLNIEETAQIFASTIKLIINENPKAFDEITLAASAKITSHTDSYSNYLNKFLK
jgi:hypothetical protein